MCSVTPRSFWGCSGLKMHPEWRPVLRGRQTDTCREDGRTWEALRRGLQRVE